MANPKRPPADLESSTVSPAPGDEKRGRREDDHNIAGMGGGIAGPAEAGAASTAGGGTAVGGEAAVPSAPTDNRKRR